MAQTAAAAAGAGALASTPASRGKAVTPGPETVLPALPPKVRSGRSTSVDRQPSSVLPGVAASGLAATAAAPSGTHLNRAGASTAGALHDPHSVTGGLMTATPGSSLVADSAPTMPGGGGGGGMAADPDDAAGGDPLAARAPSAAGVLHGAAPGSAMRRPEAVPLTSEQRRRAVQEERRRAKQEDERMRDNQAWASILAEEAALARQQRRLPLPLHVLELALSNLCPCPESQGFVYTRFCLPNRPQIVPSLASLGHYRYIQTLELPGCGISDASFLVDLPYLTFLDLSNNVLTAVPSFPPEQAPYHLQYMDLSRNRIAVMQHVAIHEHIQRLCLDQNHIERIDDVAELLYLEELSLRENRLASLDGIPATLRQLDVSQNAITSLEPIRRCRHLSELRAARNRISALPDGLAAALPYLMTLDLAKNPVTSFETLKPMQQLVHLAIDIAHTQRLQVLFHMSHLQVLNGLAVRVTEKVAARNTFDPPVHVLRAKARIQYMLQLNVFRAQLWVLPHEPIQNPVILTGPPGMRKRELVRQLQGAHPGMFIRISTCTTRPPDEDEIPTLLHHSGVPFQFLDASRFALLRDGGAFLHARQVGDDWYGINRDLVLNCVLSGRTALLLMDPAAAAETLAAIHRINAIQQSEHGDPAKGGYKHPHWRVFEPQVLQLYRSSRGPAPDRPEPPATALGDADHLDAVYRQILAMARMPALAPPAPGMAQPLPDEPDEEEVAEAAAAAAAQEAAGTAAAEAADGAASAPSGANPAGDATNAAEGPAGPRGDPAATVGPTASASQEGFDEAEDEDDDDDNDDGLDDDDDDMASEYSNDM
ncbi:hypothetical protein CXG81DRAFT_27703 [Caulochytrium protostelioides]|uniref:Guanylate kinase-like domain-containing protein n=1 Tax=Caulochytrium protostelioides TaxID=1555241 RepID=A0A4P9X3F8_9FUNG|nr:hypothetical protein CXG81DRAFT_27703 [Caulochytrium protostelioides]|eukprot:RKO99544.1 hypothetical protein CXG81DRAFT_27703 [Caulochytrium protostelioides]